MKYHGVTNYLENKSNIQTKKLNIECFKYNIFSKEALNIIQKWHDKYLNFFINNDCIFNLSAGLDSRVLLSFLIKTDKEFLIDNYHRTTTNFKVDDKYDIELVSHFDLAKVEIITAVCQLFLLRFGKYVIRLWSLRSQVTRL